MRPKWLPADLALIGEVIARYDGEDDDHAHQVIDGWSPWAQALVAAGLQP